MTAADMPRRLTAEAIGTAMLLAAVVGSGIMADTKADTGAPGHPKAGRREWIGTGTP